MCGWKIHKGFAEEAQRYISDPVMDKWSEIIEKKCNSEVYMVGHSLGGAVASVVAGCSNRRKLSNLNTRTDATWVKDRPFWAKGLYTIGAPAVAKTPLTDERSLIEQAQAVSSIIKGKLKGKKKESLKKEDHKLKETAKKEEHKEEGKALSDLTHVAGIQLSESTADEAEF